MGQGKLREAREGEDREREISEDIETVAGAAGETEAGCGRDVEKTTDGEASSRKKISGGRRGCQKVAEDYQ